MERHSYIYGLFDPADQVIRYVGQTTRPNARLCMHKSENPNPNNGSVAKDWIASILQEDRYPCMIILEVCDFACAHQLEAEWYRRLCGAGYPIINNTSKFNKPHSSSKAKPYKNPLTYRQFSIIEVGMIYILHDPASPESQQKFGTILEAMKQLGNGNLSAGIRKAIEMTTQPRNITESWLQQWIDTNRPDLGLFEVNGIKGFYRLDAGPAHSFRGVGKTWKQVAAELEAIQLPDAV